LEILKNEELNNVVGGGLTFKLLMSIVGVSSFVIGLIDGLIRPLKCRNY